MSTNTASMPELVVCQTPCIEGKVNRLVGEHRRSVRFTLERGMATAEYAVGILAAVALALVLLKVVTHESFFGAMLKIVVMVIGKIGGMLP